MRFAYCAFDKAGRPVADVLDAAGEAEAREALRRQGLFVTQVTGTDPSLPAPVAVTAGVIPTRRAGHRNVRTLASFTRQLYVLLKSGTQVVPALAALERQAKDAKWRAVVGGMRSRLEEGASLSAAMEAYPDHFDPICRSLVAAGEAGGRLPEMLDRLASLLRKEAHVRGAVKGAMVYPAVLILISTSVLVVMLTFVLPRFSGMFKTMDVPLPASTQVLLVISHILLNYWWALILGLGGLVFGVKAWLATAAGRNAVDGVVIRLPVFGPIVRGFATARIARLLGVQFESHVPLLEALRLTREAAGSAAYARLVAGAEEAATRGESITVAFSDARLISPSICEAIRNGEQTGQVGPLLLNIADLLDEENDVVIKSLTSILEPVILVVLGVIVGVVATSMFLPLFDLTAMTQGGG